MPALEITNLRVDYGDFTAVDELNVTVERGEIFGLVGPNGAGKTSTIRVLATLLEPTYGEVHIAGYDLFEQPTEVHSLMAYMPDLAPLIPDLKVWEFLDLFAQSYGYVGSEKRNRVDACLDKVQLGDKRNVYGKALSRGMTQRVVLAKSLLHNPKLLLLDEPASGMDPIARRTMRHILQDLAADGATVVLSSHILSELADMCTSVGIMHLGKLITDGPISTVMNSLESERSLIHVEVTDSIESAVAWLQNQRSVETIQVEGSRIAFSIPGDKTVHAQLLAQMIEQEISISSFAPQVSGIESLLMTLIEKH